MDYRSDALVAWQQDGAIYARMVRANGLPDPTQRVGPSEPGPQLQALVSDNGHGMIAWSSTSGGKGAGPRTVVRLALSMAHERFLGYRLIASYADPGGAGREPGSLQLVRLSGENVMLAWSARLQGRYVALAAPAVFAAIRPSTRLSRGAGRGAGQAVLAALVPGPANDAIALWRRAPGAPAAPDWGTSELWASRTVLRRGLVASADPAQLGPAGSGAAPPSGSIRPMIAASSHGRRRPAGRASCTRSDRRIPASATGGSPRLPARPPACTGCA